MKGGNFFNKFLDALDGSYCLPSEEEGKRQCKYNYIR